MTPNPLELPDFSSMSEDDALQFVEGIRKRRLVAYESYKQAVMLRQREKNEKTKAKIDQQMRLFEKELTKLDKTIENVEKRARKLQALRLEIVPFNEETTL